MYHQYHNKTDRVIYDTNDNFRQTFKISCYSFNQQHHNKHHMTTCLIFKIIMDVGKNESNTCNYRQKDQRITAL